MLRAIAALDVRPDHLLIDAMALDIDIPQTSIIKGDAKSISIAAASVLAKEHRDQYMKQLSKNIMFTVLKKCRLWYTTTS